MVSRRSALCAALLASLCLAGCSGGDSNRFGMSGQVTYQGTPVPRGQVSVMPDRSKANRGPQGFAEIRDGKYEIVPDKGVVSGPVIIKISGADGEDVSWDQGRPYGN